MVQVKQAGRKLAEIENSQPNETKDTNGTSGVQVDLDQMFSFLTEVQQTPLDEKLITDGTGVTAEEPTGDAGQKEDPSKKNHAPPENNAEPNAPVQNGYGGDQDTQEVVEKPPATVEEKNSLPSGVDKPESKVAVVIEGTEQGTPQNAPRAASPIKPEDTDSECNGEDEEEVRTTYMTSNV